MAPSAFAEKDFSKIFCDPTGYGHIFIDRIRAWDWYTLVYDNTDNDAYYCPKLVTSFYNTIDHASVDLNTYQFTVHMPLGDIFITLPLLEELMHLPIYPQHSNPLHS